MSLSKYQTAIWYPDSHTLQIDLASWLNLSGTLRLTSWDHDFGITASIINTDAIEHHDDPFKCFHFPILECLDQTSCIDYLNQIPVDVKQPLRRYRSDSFGILTLLSQHPFLAPLYVKYPTLFWLAFRVAQAQNWNKQQLVNVCNQGEWAMLKVCPLPNNAAALEVITKFAAEQFGQLQQDLIKRLFAELDYQHLNSIRDNLPSHLIQFLLRYPELQHAKLIQQLNKADYNNLLRIVRNLWTIAAELNMNTVEVQNLITECENIPALKSVENRFSAANSDRLLRLYEKKLGSVPGASRCFTTPPIADSENIIAITNAAELFAESKELKHDLIRFCDQIGDGHYYAYKILKPVRATLLLYLFRNNQNAVVPVIKDVITIYGQSSMSTAIEHIERWIKQRS